MFQYVYKRNVKFEHIAVQNCEVFEAGKQYNLYVLDEDIFIGPTLLLASQDTRTDLKFFGRAEVFNPQRGSKSWVVQTRRIKEEHDGK